MLLAVSSRSIVSTAATAGLVGTVRLYRQT